MNNLSLTVHQWPASPQAWKAAASVGHGLVVLGANTPDSPIRHAARERVRLALHQVLSALLNRAPETIELVSQPGQALRLEQPDQGIGLSVTHEPGLSLAAIYLHGAVGIDLMRISEEPEWRSDWEDVASIYLAQSAKVRIINEPPGMRALAFAKEWTRLEASLKLHGLPLSESTPSLECQLEQSHLIDLSLPPGLVGSVALLPLSNKQPPR